MQDNDHNTINRQEERKEGWGEDGRGRGTKLVGDGEERKEAWKEDGKEGWWEGGKRRKKRSPKGKIKEL